MKNRALALLAGLALAPGASEAQPRPSRPDAPGLHAVTNARAATVSAPAPPCTGERALRYGFFAYFQPVSFSADGDPQSIGYREHRGSEADLLTALEAMADTDLSFDRVPIGEWPGIWLAPASPRFDMAGGGITILDDRTRDADGAPAVAFTSSHIRFRQSLLVRADDADRLRTYDDLTRDVVVGAVAGTTGEERLLQLAGLADERGALAAGVRVVTRGGTLTANGSAAFTVTAAASSPRLAGRTRLLPAAADMPQVVHLGEDEKAYVAALAAGEIDAFARGEIGNRAAAAASGGALAVTALDPAVEHAGFTVPAADEALLRCVNARVNYLTDGGAVGYREWAADPGVFAARAAAWNRGR